jgi:hypothetical protein
MLGSYLLSLGNSNCHWQFYLFFYFFKKRNRKLKKINKRNK